MTAKDINIEVSLKIKEILKEKGLTVKELAELLGIKSRSLELIIDCKESISVPAYLYLSKIGKFCLKWVFYSGLYASGSTRSSV